MSGSRGRPKNQPDYDVEKQQMDLINEAVELFEIPFDDRVLRDPDAPSLREVAEHMNTTILRVRKLLISARFYSTEISRAVQEMKKEGKSVYSVAILKKLYKAA